MQMIVIRIVSILLACVPLLMAAFFLLFTVPRKLLIVQQDLRKLKFGGESASPSSVSGGEPDLQAGRRVAATPADAARAARRASNR